MNGPVTEEITERGTKGWSLEKFLPSLQLLVTIGIAVGGFLVNTKVETNKSTIDQAKLKIEETNQKLNGITAEFEKDKKFADEVNNAIDQLSEGKPVKAKMTLVRLYILADNENTKYKYHLVHLAVASGKPELLETITALFQGETSQEKKRALEAPILVAARNILAGKNEKESPATQRELNTDELIASSSKNQTSAKAEALVKAEASLLSQLTPKDLTGWVFLGRENRTTKKFESAVISSSQGFPKDKQEVAVIQDINIRRQRPQNNYTVNNLPELIGTSKRGSKVKIIGDVSRVYSKSGNIGVWSKVEVTEKV